MEGIWNLASHILGITIIHSLWQGLLIYMVIRLALLCLPTQTARLKYQLFTAGLLGTALWFTCTLWQQVQLYTASPAPLKPLHLGDLLALSGFRPTAQVSSRYEFDLNIYLPYLTALYMGGFTVNGLRLLYSWYHIRQLKKSGIVSEHFQNQLKALAQHLKIKVPVKAMLSRFVTVPCVTGFIKPVLLLPITLSTSLTAEEAESILLHELTHISRNDFLWNLFQQLITMLLFFNPFVHLLSRSINEERENSCDDLVIAVTGQPLIYAQALYKLENQRQIFEHPRLALAATGNKYHLLNRIQRIMKTPKNHLNLKPTLLAMLLFAAGIGLITLFQPQIAEGKVSIKAIKPALEKLFAIALAKTDTVPDRKSSVKKNTKAKTAKASRNSNIEGDVPAYDVFDPKMKALMAYLQKQSLALSQHYSNPDFKKMQQALTANGEQMQALYNDNDVSRLTEEMSKAGADFGAQWGNNPKMQELSSKMGIAGSKIGAYYSSADFKKLDKELRKKYSLPADYNFNYNNSDPKYKAYQDELQSKIPANIQQQQDAIKAMGEDMKKVYEAPEYKAAQKRLQVLGDSIGKAYSNPKMKEVQAQMKLYGEQMSKWQNSPEFKKQQELLKETSAKIRAYAQSPEYKKHMREWSENMRTNMNKNFDHMQRDFDRQQKDFDRTQKNFDRLEKTEKPEPKEQPEIKEPKEPVED